MSYIITKIKCFVIFYYLIKKLAIKYDNNKYYDKIRNFYIL